MNADAHAIIMLAAFEMLDEQLRAALASQRDLLADAGNYPDIFDNPTKPDAEKDPVDPDWRRFCRFPDDLPGPCMHMWPKHPVTQQQHRRPMIEHLLRSASDALAGGENDAFVKFVGCLSHYIGDVCQPAHLMDLALLEQLIPPPAHWRDFHYHTDLEAVTGPCAALEPPRPLGVDVEEIAWRLAGACSLAAVDCRQYVVPSVQALFAGDDTEAQRLAQGPVTRSAQLTADVWSSLWHASRGTLPPNAETLAELDLRHWPADEQRHDSVYGAAIVDGNRRLAGAQRTVAKAMLAGDDGQPRAVTGLGVLPHSGMNGPRDTWLHYSLPPRVFDRFDAAAGLHAELGAAGAVAFVVELDGREVFRHETRDANAPATPVHVPLHDATTLTLRVEDASGGRSFWDNHTVWARPRLIRRPLTPQPNHHDTAAHAPSAG